MQQRSKSKQLLISTLYICRFYTSKKETYAFTRRKLNWHVVVSLPGQDGVLTTFEQSEWDILTESVLTSRTQVFKCLNTFAELDGLI